MVRRLGTPLGFQQHPFEICGSDPGPPNSLVAIPSAERPNPVRPPDLLDQPSRHPDPKIEHPSTDDQTTGLPPRSWGRWSGGRWLGPPGRYGEPWRRFGAVVTHGCATAVFVGKPYGITVWGRFRGDRVTHRCVTRSASNPAFSLSRKGLRKSGGHDWD